MSKDIPLAEKSQVKQIKPDKTTQSPEKQSPAGLNADEAAVLRLQQQVGNQAVQRLIAQRSGGDDGFDLNNETSNRINQARGGGQTLDSAVQTQMSGAMGHDFSGVRVHNNAESDALNQQVGAKAFTTGQDIFFKQGEYNPGSGSGKELIAHELTHVVQQSSGRVGSSGGGMTVRPAGDAFEQEADAVAKQAVSADVQMKVDKAIQRQEEEEEVAMKQDEMLQRQEEEEEEMMQPKLDDSVQRQEEEEEEEMMQPKLDDSVQLQAEEEEEPVQTKSIQRQEELPEEEL